MLYNGLLARAWKMPPSERGLEMLKGLLHEAPEGLDEVMITRQLASCLRRLDRGVEARRALEDAVQRWPNAPWPLTSLALCERRDGNWARAIQRAEEACRLDPVVPWSSFALNALTDLLANAPDEKLRDLDMGAVGRITAGDREGFRSYVIRTGATICGRNAIDILMRIVPGDACAELLRYDTSGNMTSDWSHSVSYAALSFRASGDGPAHEEPDDDAALRSGDRAWLLNLARESIRSSLDKQEPPVAPPEDSPSIFRAERATFVTLKVPARGGCRLRGCIGNMEPCRPLYRSVFENARKAAFSDPRFDPLERHELDRVRIEISVLTPMRPVADPSEIVPGRDGVQLSRSGRTAVFLPQVATEQGWDRIALLENLCRKAGLARTAWKKAKLLVFRAIVFGEPPAWNKEC